MCKFIVSAVCATLAVCLCMMILCPQAEVILHVRVGAQQCGPETIRATGRRMSREVLVTALTTTYRLRRGSMHDCHWQLQRSLWWKTSVTWQRLQLRSFLLTCFFLPCPDSSKEAGLVRTHMQGFCRAGLFWKSWVYFFCEVVKHELKMRLEFCYHIVVLALNNKKLDLFKFLQMPFTSHPTATAQLIFTPRLYCPTHRPLFVDK